MKKDELNAMRAVYDEFGLDLTDISPQI